MAKQVPLRAVVDNVYVNGRRQKLLVDTLSVIKVAVQQTPQGGFDLEEQRKRFRILDQTDKVDDLIKDEERLKENATDEDVEAFIKKRAESLNKTYEQVEGTLTLEDSDFETLKKCMAGYKPQYLSRELDNFLNEIATGKGKDQEETAIPKIGGKSRSKND